MAVAPICILISRAFRTLEHSWGSLGVLLGPSWGPPGALSWGSLQVLIGLSGSPLGALLGPLGALWVGVWEPSWGSFGMPEGPLGAVLGPFV
eukprot:9471631-Pyramimonas_sp.AAC.1